MGRGNRYLTEDELAKRPKVTRQLIARVWDMLRPYWR